MPEDLPQLVADPRLVRQILINLVTNAVKYAGKEGRIEVSVDVDDGGRMDLVVRDDGVGIPKHKLRHVMEPFGQLKDPTVHEDGYQGTGLGLPLAKAMTELHQGTFEIDSDEGCGTCVTVRFPKVRVRPLSVS